MPSKMNGILAAVAAAGVLAMAGASSASAVTITGGGVFSATAGASRLVITKTSGSIPLNCTTSGGSVAISSGTYTTFPAVVGTATPTFSSCSGPSGLVYSVACTQTSISFTGGPVGGTTPGTFPVDCDITFVAGSTCKFKVTGSVNISYTNPGVTPPSPNTNGAVTIFVAGQALSVASTNGLCGALAAVGDKADFGAPGTGALGLNNIVYRFTTVGVVVT